MRAHSSLRFALLLGAGALSAGCAGPPEPPLRVGLLLWPPYSLFVVAQDQGYIGPDVELVDLRSPADAMRAYRNGAIDLLPLTLEFGLTALAEDSTQRVVLVIDVSMGGDAILARPDIASLADLSGRRVGIEASPLGTYLLLRALERTSLSMAELEIVPVDVADHVEAYRSGRVDAVVTYEPARTRVLGLGARELFTSREIPGEIVDVLLVPEPLAMRREAEVREIVAGWLRARDRYIAAPDSVAAGMAAREGLTPAELRRALDGVGLPGLAENAAILSGRDSLVLQGWRRHAAFMHEQGLLSRPVDPVRLLTDRFLPGPARP